MVVRNLLETEQSLFVLLHTHVILSTCIMLQSTVVYSILDNYKLCTKSMQWVSEYYCAFSLITRPYMYNSNLLGNLSLFAHVSTVTRSLWNYNVQNWASYRLWWWEYFLDIISNGQTRRIINQLKDKCEELTEVLQPFC